MGETQMNVRLLAHTRLSTEFENLLWAEDVENHTANSSVDDGAIIALTAIRTCYSPNKPSEIVVKEGEKYFGRAATDDQGGTEADRLFRQIVASKHTSTLEHITFTFSIEGISRACLAQLTRHRIGFSYSVQSQRFVKFGTNDKTGGFDYVMPQSIRGTHAQIDFEAIMADIQYTYDELRAIGIPAEDARAILPQAAATNLVLTANLRALLDFYSKRRKGSGAQWEIAELAERLKEEVIKVEPWTEPFFGTTDEE